MVSEKIAKLINEQIAHEQYAARMPKSPPKSNRQGFAPSIQREWRNGLGASAHVNVHSLFDEYGGRPAGREEDERGGTTAIAPSSRTIRSRPSRK